MEPETYSIQTKGSKRMNIEMINERIQLRLSKFLEPYGYKQTNNESFRKYASDGYHEIIPLVTDYHPDYDIDFAMLIRVNRVDEIVDKFEENSRRVEKNTVSRALLGRIRTGKNRPAYQISNEYELLLSLEDLATYLVDSGFDHFKRYSDIQMLDKAFNSNPLGFCIHQPSVTRRPIYGIILAKLSNRSDFENIVNIYQREYVHITVVDSFQREFQNVLEYLRNL